jgi:putative copper resistance protein D
LRASWTFPLSNAVTADPLVWLRWLQFVSLGLVFGVPLAARLSGERFCHRAMARGVILACLLGMVGTGLGFLVTLAHMAGIGVGELDRPLVTLMLAGSALGWSVLVRATALALTMIACIAVQRPRLDGIVAAGAVAAASLAWAGHGAASVGMAGVARLAGDIVHLWAGMLWLGALALFTARLWRVDPDETPRLQRLAKGLGDFALTGTLLVAILLVSGLANLLHLARPDQWLGAMATPYGILMAAKLALFAAMLILAAANRFHLAPRLHNALAKEADGRPARRGAVAALRHSVTMETLLAVAVIWCVSYAGTQAPFAP